MAPATVSRFAVLAVVSFVASLAFALAKQQVRPNIILVLADDLDVRLNSTEKALRRTRELFLRHGAEFVNAFVTTPVCCPSRSSLLTGQYAHNHGALTNNEECYSKRWQRQAEQRTIGPLLQRSGYYTAYLGKYLNGYKGDRIPPGWNHWFAQERNSRYINYTMVRGSSVVGKNNRKGSKANFITKKRYRGTDSYFTSVLMQETEKVLDKQLRKPNGKPLFLMVSLPAPHGTEDPEPKYNNNFTNVKVPRNKNFNVRSPDKHWIVQWRHKLSRSECDLVDFIYRRRLQTLLSVDDYFVRLFDKLRRLRALENRNTYVFFTSDHGFHLGTFSMLKGKNQPYEEDIRVPFYAIGPLITPGQRIDKIVLNIDLAPTFMRIAKQPVPSDMDGMSILRLLRRGRHLGNSSVAWRTSFLVEKFKARYKHYFDSKDHFFFDTPFGFPLELIAIGDKGATHQILSKKNNHIYFYQILQGHQQMNASRKRLRSNTTVAMRLQELIKFSKWMINNNCRHKQKLRKCIVQYLNRDTSTRRRRQQRQLEFEDEVIRPDLEPEAVLELVDVQKRCNCTPREMSASQRCLGNSGWQCVQLKRCGLRMNRLWQTNKISEEYLSEHDREERRCMRAKRCKLQGLSCQLVTHRHWKTPPFYAGPDICHCPNTPNSSYWCERRIDGRHNYLYCKFVTGLVEYFDMRPDADPWQLHNAWRDLNDILPNGRSIRHRLNWRLSSLRSCRYGSCNSAEGMRGTDRLWKPKNKRHRQRRVHRSQRKRARVDLQ